MTPNITEERIALSPYNLCDGCGWVCENHPSLSWEPESDSPYSCGCGAGMPCPGCISCTVPKNGQDERIALVATAVAPHCYNGPSARLAAEAAIEALTRTDNDVSGLVEALEEIAAPVVRPPRTPDEAFTQREALRDIAANALAKHRQSQGGEA